VGVDNETSRVTFASSTVERIGKNKMPTPK